MRIFTNFKLRLTGRLPLASADTLSNDRTGLLNECGFFYLEQEVQ
jgi:hypothetical protein